VVRAFRSVLGFVLGAGLVALACADEDPTGVGGPLVPGGVVRTYEIVLDPEVFLVSDTTLGGFFTPDLVLYRVLASAYEGVTANGLARFARPPSTVSYTTNTGATATDTMPSFIGGRVVVFLDTLRSVAPGPVELELHRVGEEWDPGSASWTLRVDSGGVQLPWTEPGGTSAALVGTATWDPAGGDSVSFDVDSLTVALWADTLDASRGALIRVATPGSRLRSPSVVLRLNARPSARPDTVVTTSVGSIGGSFVYDPEPLPGSELRIGGVPSWRSYFQVQRLDTLTVPCPDEPAGSGCVLRLNEVKVNYAALVLQPDATPGGFVPDDSLRIQARTVLAMPGVPLARSPLGSLAGAIAAPPIGPATFQPGASAGAIEVPLTQYIATLAAGRSPDDKTDPPQWFVLYASQESGLFGFGTFRDIGSASPPRLRLIVTVATDVEIR